MSSAGATRLAYSPTWVTTGNLVQGAFCLLMFSLPLEAPDRLPYEVTNLAGGLFIASTLLAPVLCYRRIPAAVAWFGLMYLMLAAAVVTVGVRYPGGLDFDEIFKQFALVLLAVLACWASSNLLRDDRFARAAVWSLIAGCMVRAALPVFGIATSYHVEGSGVVRVSALGQNPNQSAQILAAGLLLFVGLVYLRSRPVPAWQRMLGLAGTLLLSYGIAHTGSRGGFLTVVVGVLVILATGPSGRRLRSITLGVLMLVTLIGLALETDVMRTRLQHAATTGRMAQREYIYPNLLQMFVERPLLGWGPITNKYELAARLGDPEYGRKDTHNLALELLTSGGLLATLPFLLGALLCVRSAWRGRAGAMGNLPLAVLLALLAGNMSQNRFSAFLLWIIMGLALAVHGPAPGTAPPLLPSRARRFRPGESPVWPAPRGTP